MQLAISTATAACSVALVDGSTIVAEMHELVGRGHAERLIPMIEALPAHGRADAIWVDCGPGSFTGIRVGIAAARALALAWRIPLSGFSALAVTAIAAMASEEQEEEIAVAFNGGHGDLFVQQFHRLPFAPVNDLASLTPDRAAAAISARVVVGSGAEALVALRSFGVARDGAPRAADARLLPPDLCALPPVPLYGRLPDARPL